MIWILIAAGGSIGALARWIATIVVPNHRSGFPMSITVVNIVGSFMLGLAIGFDRAGVVAIDLLPLTSGALGGFTTFSTWMVDIDTAESGRLSTAIAVLPALVGVAAGAIGLAMGSSVS
jgi:CrcB protein